MERIKYVINKIFSLQLYNGVTVKRTIFNAGFVSFEKLLRIITAFFYTPWFANYIGIDGLGLYSYLFAYEQLFMVFIELGIGTPVVKEFLETKDKGKVLGSILGLRFMGGFVAAVGMICVYWFLNRGNTLFLTIATISSIKLILQSFFVYELFLQSTSNFKIISRTRIISHIITLSLQIIFILTNKSLEWFIFTYLLETLIIVFLTYWGYLSISFEKVRLKFSLEYLKKVFIRYYPIIVTALAATVYQRIGRVIVGEYVDKEALALYSITIKLTEVWFFAIMSMNTVLFPIIVGNKSLGNGKYEVYSKRLFIIMTWIGIALTVFIMVGSNVFLRILYDPVYWEAGKYVLVYSLMSILTAQGVISSTWYIAEDKTKENMYIYVIGAIIGVPIVYLFTVSLGAWGTAISTVLTTFLIVNILPFFFKETKPVAVALLRSYNLFELIKDLKTVLKQNSR